jgi:hypothetical protein
MPYRVYIIIFIIPWFVFLLNRVHFYKKENYTFFAMKNKLIRKKGLS